MKKLILSGATGFLGSNIIRRAVESGEFEIVAITSKPERLSAITSAPVTPLETQTFLAGGSRFDGEDVFVNCLFPTNADGWRMADGLTKVFGMIEAARESGVGAMINISSQSVYDPKRTEAASEDSPLCPESSYAVGKVSSELFCSSVFRGLPFTNLRLASMLGAGYDQRIVNRMVLQALRGEDLKVVGGMQRYGFLDVRDAAAGIVRAAQSPEKLPGAPLNLGCRECYTLLELVELIVQGMKTLGGMDVHYAVTEGQDTRNSALNAERFMTLFDWKPEIGIRQTVEDIIADLIKKAGM